MSVSPPDDVDVDDHLNATTGVRERSTRMYYRADDVVIAEFFAANGSKSEALCNLIYLYSVDYGVDTDVSQLVRENMVRLADKHGGGEVK